MKAVLTPRFGEPEVLTLGEIATPNIRPHDLLVAVKAAGVNRADLTFRKGGYGRVDFGDSETIGLEVAGVVSDVGGEVKTHEVGDRVMGIVGGGGYAQFARVQAGMAMRIPDEMDFVTAAAIPEAFVTAHEALFHLGKADAHSAVLIHAGASGVGTAAIQLARAAGALVAATASTGKLDRLRDLGAQVVAGYDREDFYEVVRGALGEAPFDVVLDFIGAPNFNRNLKLLKNGGRLVQVGLMAGLEGTHLPLSELVHRNLQVIGTIMKSRTSEEKAAMVRRFSDRWMSALTSGQVRPVIDKVFPLAAASEAHRRMESHESVGKIVLEVN